MGEAQAQIESKPRPGKWDGKERIYLFVEGESARALDFLSKYPDDDDDSEIVTIRKVDEIQLDQLNETHIVIPVVRDINAAKKEQLRVPSKFEGVPDSVMNVETVGDTIECKPVPVAEFYTRARGRRGSAEFRQGDFINAVGKACVVQTKLGVCVLACPRIKRVGNNMDGHKQFLVLRWG